jgi:hypothetical protein
LIKNKKKILNTKNGKHKKDLSLPSKSNKNIINSLKVKLGKNLRYKTQNRYNSQKNRRNKNNPKFKFVFEKPFTKGFTDDRKIHVSDILHFDSTYNDFSKINNIMYKSSKTPLTHLIGRSTPFHQKQQKEKYLL